jgi:hypothetical protein
MVTVKLYVEGAGQTDLERSQCRQAFSKFFESAGLAGKLPRTVPCGGRQSAYDAFITALRSAKAGDLPLLLVDAEGAVAMGQTVWQHLKSRDNWDKPAGVGDDQAFLMVQVMETWFLADREMLRAYFGPEFAEKHLHAWPSLEDVPKQTVYDALERATANCKQKAYAKGKVSFEVLEKVDPGKVEIACPHAKAFLERMRRL